MGINCAIVHLRNRQKGVSNGKNAGLKEIRGRYVAFPDDDCFYEKDTLERVFKFFQETEGRQGLFGRGLDPGSRKEALGYPAERFSFTRPGILGSFLGSNGRSFLRRRWSGRWGSLTIILASAAGGVRGRNGFCHSMPKKRLLHFFRSGNPCLSPPGGARYDGNGEDQGICRGFWGPLPPLWIDQAFSV